MSDPKEILDGIVALVKANPGIGHGEVSEKLGNPVSRPTLTRYFKSLIEDNRIIQTGVSSGTRYFSGDVQDFLGIPVAKRPVAIFNRHRATAGLPKFNSTQLSQLTKSAGTPAGTAAINANAIRERLMVELSYASSSLEGNTYTLLQTEVLLAYGQQAGGKTLQEAKMILNHRDAIRYLIENVTAASIDLQTIKDVHALVSDGLLDIPADSGRVRSHRVSISNSTYEPLDNKYQLGENFNQLIQAIKEEKNPFNQSLMLLTGISYLQPFADCNKRTGRIMANLPLIQAGLPPLSFVTVDKSDYVHGLLAYYEMGEGSLITNAYLQGYLQSAQTYLSHSNVEPKTVERQSAELKYRSFIRAELQRIILGTKPKPVMALPDSIPEEDRAMVATILKDDLKSLHVGRAVVLGVKPEDIEMFLKKSANNNQPDPFAPTV